MRNIFQTGRPVNFKHGTVHKWSTKTRIIDKDMTSKVKDQGRKVTCHVVRLTGVGRRSELTWPVIKACEVGLYRAYSAYRAYRWAYRCGHTVWAAPGGYKLVQYHQRSEIRAVSRSLSRNIPRYMLRPMATYCKVQWLVTGQQSSCYTDSQGFTCGLEHSAVLFSS